MLARSLTAFAATAVVPEVPALAQVTETGRSASLTLTGTKFFRDDDLN